MVVAALWGKRSAALSSHDLAALAAIDSGPALQGDTAIIDGASTPPTVDAASPQIQVTSAQSYPLGFVAAMSGTGASGSAIEQLAAFTQSASGAPWTISLLVDVPTVEVSTAAPAPGAVASIGGAALDALAASWQQWAQSGAPPTGGAVPFAATAAYSTVGTQQAQQVGLSALRGVHEQVVFQSEPASLLQFPGQTSTVCGAVQETAVFTGASGGAVTQPPDQATWGASVAPGPYRSVTEESVYQVCLASVNGAVHVLGGNGGQFSVSAAPAG